MDRLARLLDDVTGRDKVMRTAQYLAKLAVVLMTRASSDQRQAVAALERVIQAIGDGRRLFRVGKFVSSGLAARKGLIDHVLRQWHLHGAANVALRNALLFWYYLLDHYVWLLRLRLLENAQLSHVQLAAMRLWSASTTISFVADVYTYYCRPPSDPDARTNLRLKLTKTACDLPLVFTSSFPSHARLISPAFVTASGCISSIAGLVISWRSTHL